MGRLVKSALFSILLIFGSVVVANTAEVKLPMRNVILMVRDAYACGMVIGLSDNKEADPLDKEGLQRERDIKEWDRIQKNTFHCDKIDLVRNMPVDEPK